ncbi:hypothetical protein ANCCEY_09905 [Ancylostoma ceylanicum]|uniref:Major facilitator superfamily (MFS) profile domain-containing protein n=1 Tax=Ancylostoma ceylanicum TaxID=53326 RepID=A0A0D6LFZ9_9BILA|nr:hypothetical protein ANCCEY_09905 [Ancylostoma ceylanicum]
MSVEGRTSSANENQRLSDGKISQDCTIFKECRNNLTFYDDYFQSAAMEVAGFASRGCLVTDLDGSAAKTRTFTFGTLSDMYGRKPLSLTVLSMGFVATLLSGFAPSWQVLHTLRFFVGLCIGGALVTFGTFVTELLLPQQRMVLRGIFNWISEQGRTREMREAERYIARFAGVEYKPVERKPVEHGVFEMLRSPGLFRRLGVLWMMWFVAAFCEYGNNLNSNSIGGNLFTNQYLFAVFIIVAKWGAGILIINLVGTAFLEYTWDACFLCAMESFETSCRGACTGSCSLMARIGAIASPFIETKGVDLDNVTNETVEQKGDHLLAQNHLGIELKPTSLDKFENEDAPLNQRSS